MSTQTAPPPAGPRLPAGLDGALAGGLDALREIALAAAGTADAPLWSQSTEQLERALGLIEWSRHYLAAVERRVVGEAVERGLPGDAGYSATDWTTRHLGRAVPAPAPHHAASVVRLAAAEARDSADLRLVFDRLSSRELSVSKADQLVRFHEEVEAVADAELLSRDMARIVEGASDDGVLADATGAARVRGLTDRQLRVLLRRARPLLQPAADLDRDQERAQRGRALFKVAGAAGLAEYRWLLEPEAAAIVDAAIAGLSAPQPSDDGTPDPRPAARRRADALLDLVTRAVGCADDALPRTEKTQLMVLVNWDDLRQATGSGTTLTGEVLAPGVVRRLSCDAKITPVVLGGPSEPLDVGRAQRLFSPAQRKALWLRDRGCTFPGCTMPPQWTDAHHVRHWVQGGSTDLLNAALLCQRHHTHVHRRELTATVTGSGVTWHV